MNPLNIPGINGFKTALGSWTQIIGGLLLALGQLTKLVADCLEGATPLDACIDQAPLLITGVIVAANGLSQLGLGHKIEKATQ